MYRKKFIAIKIFLIVIGILFSFELCPAVTLSNLSVSPSSITAGGYITTSFNINTGSATSYYVIALSPFANFNCSEFNASSPTQYNLFVVNKDGVYDSTMSIPDYIGPDSSKQGSGMGYGIEISTGGSTQSLTYVFKVPPDAPSGNVYVHVLANDWSINAYPLSCNPAAILDSSAINVTAIDDCRRLDLEMFNPTSASTTAQVIQMGIRITNYGIWPVPINGLKYRWWFTDDSTGFGDSNSVPTNNQELFAGNNRSYLGQVGTMTQSWDHLSAEQNCTGNRNAYYYTKVVISGSAGQVIPGGGGYLSTHDNESDAGLRFHITAPTSWDYFDSYTDDYSRHMDFGYGFSNHNSSKYVTLYDSDGNLLREYIGWDSFDPNTGEEPCNITSSLPVCGGESTIYVTKSVNKQIVSLGETITYCLSIYNNTGSTQTFNVWDTIPYVTTYRGCDNSCGTTTIGSNFIVYWTISNLAAGETVQRCFWVEVTSLPENWFERYFFCTIKKK